MKVICCRDGEDERNEGREGEGEGENIWVCMLCRGGEVRDGRMVC